MIYNDKNNNAITGSNYGQALTEREEVDICMLAPNLEPETVG